MRNKSRSILGKNWTQRRADIEESRKKLDISNQEFRELNLKKWSIIEKNIENKFLCKRKAGLKSTWLWEDIKTEVFVIACEHDPYAKLDFLAKKDELFYFFVNETINEATKYWYYEGNIKAIINIIGNTGLNEYYLVSKKYDWLLCVNHHDIVIGAGTIIPKLQMNRGKLKS